MTALPPGHAFIIRDVTLTLGMTAFANAITEGTLTPDTPVQTLRTSVPDGVYQDVDTTAWTLGLAGVADWAAAGIAKYLNDHNGETVSCVLAPKAGGPQATFDMVCVPVPFGGARGAWNTFSKQNFAVVGQPVFDDES